jgi:hypothetical protein
MLFNSIHFALFFVVVTTLYFLLPHKVDAFIGLWLKDKAQFL